MDRLTLSLLVQAEVKIQETFQIKFFQILQNKIVPCKSTVKENSFEWSHHRISSTDTNFTTLFYVSIIDSGSEYEKDAILSCHERGTK